MNETKSYVRKDPSGAYRVGQTKVSLDSVVISYLNGCSPETIQDDFPVLSLEEVYGAIAFYLANRKEVDEYLERQDRLFEKLREKWEKDPDPMLKRLRAIKAGSTQVNA